MCICYNINEEYLGQIMSCRVAVLKEIILLDYSKIYYGHGFDVLVDHEDLNPADENFSAAFFCCLLLTYSETLS